MIIVQSTPIPGKRKFQVKFLDDSVHPEQSLIFICKIPYPNVATTSTILSGSTVFKDLDAFYRLGYLRMVRPNLSKIVRKLEKRGVTNMQLVSFFNNLHLQNKAECDLAHLRKSLSDILKYGVLT